jgi:hypothetical protein
MAQTTKFVRIGVMAIIIAAVVAVASVIAFAYVDYIKGQAQYVDREVTTIIKEER